MLLRPITLGLIPEGLLLEGGPPGIAPPLALDALLAKLTYLVADVNPRGEGFMLFVLHPCV